MLQVVFKSRKMCQNKVTMTKRPFILAGGKKENICQGFFFAKNSCISVRLWHFLFIIKWVSNSFDFLPSKFEDQPGVFRCLKMCYKKGARRVILNFIILKVSIIRKVRIAFPTDLPHNLLSLLLATV